MKLKIVLFIALLAAFGINGFAQKKKAKTVSKPAVPEFKGSPNTQKAAFKSFIIKNVGKRVSLDLSFGDDPPYGYRSEFADPVFNVDNYIYFLICNDPEDANKPWTERCKALNWNDAKKTLNGIFKITEPNPRLMRTNRTFEIIPAK